MTIDASPPPPQCMNQLVKEFHERDQQLVFAAMKGSILRCWDGAGHGDARVTVPTVSDAERLIAGETLGRWCIVTAVHGPYGVAFFVYVFLASDDLKLAEFFVLLVYSFA